MLLLKAERERWEKSAGATLHRGRRDYQQRTYGECMKEPDPNQIICDFKSRGPMITAIAPVTGETHYFAPAEYRPVTAEQRDCRLFRADREGTAKFLDCLDIGKEERPRVISLCGSEKDSSNKVACFEREGWILLDPDPAVF